MDDIFRKTLITCHTYLVENIQYEHLADHLLEYGVLPKTTLEDIGSLSPRRKQVRRLLDVLPRRSNNAFGTFLGCLRLSDQLHIAKILEDKVREIQSQIDHNPNGFLPGPKLEEQQHNYPSEQHKLQPGPSEFTSVPEQNATPITESNENDIPTSIACSEEVGACYPSPEPQQTMEIESDCYKMNTYPRGYMLIINNEKFINGSLTNRSGSSQDASDLQDLFWRLGFYCDIKHNVEVAEMKEHLSNFSKMEEHKNLSCCAVVLMSHGDESPDEHIYGINGEKVRVNDLIFYFNDQNCPNLKNKPKLFIIQACRNRKDHPTTETCENPGAQNVTFQPPRPPLLMRLMSLDLSSDAVGTCGNPNSRADMLIAYSTARGNTSFRHPLQGSIFIRKIIEVFNSKANTTSVTDMFIEVNRKLREDYNRQGQIGVPEVALTKKWYLKPV